MPRLVIVGQLARFSYVAISRFGAYSCSSFSDAVAFTFMISPPSVGRLGLCFPSFAIGQGALDINISRLRPGCMGGGKHKPKDSAAPAGGGGQDALQASRQAYKEVKSQYHIHDRANENLEKKAQNYMVASALVTTLLVTLATAHVGRPIWVSPVPYLAIVPVAGMLLTIIFCTLVNRASAHPAPIVGKRLLCHDELDEKTYAELVESEEDFYKHRIGEYARALVKLEDTNKKKAGMLKIALVAFAVSVASTIIVFVTAVAL